MPAAISSSVTSTTSSTRSRPTARASSPANGGASPSAIVGCDSMRTLLPAARPALKPGMRSGSTPTTRQSTAMATPAIRPPPPTGQTMQSTPGTSSTISRATVPWPAITCGSSNGCTSVRPVCSITASSRSCACAASSDSRSTAAPYARVAATFSGFAVLHMTTRQSTPSLAAAYATACAWFPADQVTTPRAFSSSPSERSFASTPRGLNEPVFWKSSALRKARTPRRPPSAADEKVGVRCSRPAIASRAARTSARVGSSATMHDAGAGDTDHKLALGGGPDGLSRGLVLPPPARPYGRYEQDERSRDAHPAGRHEERRTDADRIRHGPGEREPGRQEGERAHPVVRADAREPVGRDLALQGRLPHGHEEAHGDAGRELGGGDGDARLPEREQEWRRRREEDEQRASRHRSRRSPAERERPAAEAPDGEGGQHEAPRPGSTERLLGHEGAEHLH